MPNENAVDLYNPNHARLFTQVIKLNRGSLQNYIAFNDIFAQFKK